MNLHGKVALVTGGGRGIGLGCAIELARAGATIVLNDRPGSPDLESSASTIRQLGAVCHVVAADVFHRDGCMACLDAALQVVRGIDILISNPARSLRGAFLEYAAEDFESVLAGTLTAGFHMGQLFAQQLVNRRQGGKIVFISSVHAEMPMARSVAYNAAKAGLNHLARTMAVELAMHRINVNVIEPGWIETPGEHAAFGAETIRQEGAKLPWGRLGTPTDIGRAALFLASDYADYVTGSVLVVDGGFRGKDCRDAKLIQPAPLGPV